MTSGKSVLWEGVAYSLRKKETVRSVIQHVHASLRKPMFDVVHRIVDTGWIVLFFIVVSFVRRG